MSTSLPVIDLTIAKRGGGARAEVARQLDLACSEFGFFYLVGHDIAAQLTDGMLTRAREQRMRASAGKLEALSPLAALNRGYSVALGENGRVLKRTAEFAPGSDFTLRVSDGSVECRVP